MCSSDLMILDDQFHVEGYSVRDGVIYYHGRIFLSRASKLKEKLLHASHQYFLFSHTYSMRAYNTIMEGYTWEGFGQEIYQNLRRCMDHVEMEEILNSLMELSQLLLSSLGMRGDLSMSHPIYVRKVYGKDLIFMYDDLYDEYLYSFTIHVQAIVPWGSILPYKFHGQIWAINIVEHGHSLGGYRAMIYHFGCTPKAPNISHLFKTCEKTWAACGGETTYHIII